jgi:hypothetical protein
MNDAHQHTPGTHVVVEGLDGERSDAVVVGYHDQPAGEHEIDTDRGSTTLAEYWRGHGVDVDEPVVAIRYAKGVSWQGTIETWSKSTYDFPASRVRRPETDGGHQPDRITCGLCGAVHETVSDAIECCEERVRDGDSDDPGPAAVTDGGRDRLADAAERQAEALETLAERQRVTNAALAELIRTIDARAAQQIGIEEPTTGRTGRSVAGWIEDATLDLAEGVDLDAVDRVREDR